MYLVKVYYIADKHKMQTVLSLTISLSVKIM